MSEFIKHYTLKYTPLSPIHIGTGDSYEPTNYVIKDQTLYEFDTGSSVMAFSEIDKKTLLRILSGKPERRMISAVQTFFYERRDAIIPFAVNAVPVFEGVASFYDSRVGKVANKEKNGQDVIHKLEIERCAYNPINRDPVLLGSSVKGAIRTALLDQINHGKSLMRVTDKRTGQSRKESNQEIQQRLFGFRPGKFELDPMRLIQLSDAQWTSDPNLPKAQICMTVNRKKHKVLDEQGNERLSQSEGNQNLNKLLECISAFNHRAFTASLNFQQIQSLSSAFAGDKVPKQSFGIQQITQACNAFYYSKLLQEMDLLEKRGFVHKAWQKSIQSLLVSIKTDLEQGRAMLLRVGRHSGAESVTLNGVRQIKIMEGKDKATGKMRSSTDDKTKTLWLAAQYKEQRSNLLPFGWLLVEIQAGEESTFPENTTLQQLCSEQLKDAQQWADKQARLKQQRKEQIEQVRLSRERERQQQLEKQQEAERKRQEALAKQQAEAKRLAAMKPIDREIEETLNSSPDKNKRDFMVLIEAVENNTWDGADRTYVLNVIVEKMKTAKCWKESTAKKKPEKDKEYQNTLRVKKLLN